MLKVKQSLYIFFFETNRFGHFFFQKELGLECILWVYKFQLLQVNLLVTEAETRCTGFVHVKLCNIFQTKQA